jgi:hypothetical protein
MHRGEEDRFERWETKSIEEKKTNLRDERQRAGKGGDWECI